MLGRLEYRLELQTSTVVCLLIGEIVSLSYRTHMMLAMLGRLEYIEQSLVPESSAFEVQMAFENLQRHKSPGVVQINADLIKA
jgi:hypothetical protein